MSWVWGLEPPDFDEMLAAGLPLPYQPLKDPAFWVLLSAFIPYWLVAWAFIRTLVQKELGHPVIFLAVFLICLHPLCTLWLARDTKRWAVPQRTLYLILCTLTASAFTGFYLAKVRPQWLMHVEKQRYLASTRAQREQELEEFLAAKALKN